MTLLWSAPAPEASHRAAPEPLIPSPAAARWEPPLWSIRRTALAVIAALVAGALTVFGVSYADTGSGSGVGPRSGSGGFGGRGLPGGSFQGGPAGPGAMGGLGGFGQSGPGQLPGPPGSGQ
jgi:hypothetical protein